MTLTITLSPEDEKKLQAHAEANGLDVDTYIHALVKKEIEKPLTLSEILAPFRQEVEESGLTDDELDTLFREAIAEARRERRTKQGSMP
jgi:hypothetical protein